MRFVKTKNFRINFITSSYSHCMEKQACHSFLIFICQYFGPESLNTLLTYCVLTQPSKTALILTTIVNHRRQTGLCSWRVWFGGINFIETNHHFCMKKYFYNAFIHYEFLIKSTHPFLLSTMENVGSSTCLWL